jgi:hypothetical protein
MRNFFVCYNGINFSKRYIKFNYIDSEKKEINDYLLNFVLLKFFSVTNFVFCFNQIGAYDLGKD